MAGGCHAVAEFLTSEHEKYTPITQLANKLKNKWNSGPLHSAASNGHLDIIQFFISNQKCDPNFPGQCGWTLVHYATISGHLHIVKYLTDEQSCNLSCLDKHKCTPLHYAALNGRMSIVKFLTVEKNCDLMCRDFKQNTPLH